MGVKLLRKMGWKEGQGIGARIKRKTKSNTGKRLRYEERTVILQFSL